MSLPRPRPLLLFALLALAAWTVPAWGLPAPLDPAEIDTARYGVLLRRAAASLLQPLIDEKALERWLNGEARQLRLQYPLVYNLL